MQNQLDKQRKETRTNPEDASDLLARSPVDPRRRRRLRLAVGLVVAVSLTVGISRALLPGKRSEAASPALSVDHGTVILAPDAPQWQYIELAVAELGPPLQPLPAPARIAFDEPRTSSVGSPLPGRIEQITVRLGDVVHKGDRLFSVRSGSLAEVERGLSSATENLAVKRRIAERTRDLLALHAVPEKDVLDANAELKEAELALAEARAKKSSLAVSSDGSSLFWVKAPRSGTIVSLDASANQEVTPSADHSLLRVSDLDEVLALADVQERDATDLRVGDPATIHSKATGVSRQGVLEYISQVVDPQRHTVQARVRLFNRDRVLRPNAFAEVTFEMDAQKPRVRVADEAVVSDGPHTAVFVLTGPGHLERVPVEAGRQRDGITEIRKGIEPGARYAKKGAVLLLNQIDLADS